MPELLSSDHFRQKSNTLCFKKMKLVILTVFLIVNSAYCSRPTDCKCRILIQDRIVNGRLARSQSYPWMVSIQVKKLPSEYSLFLYQMQNEEKFRVKA